MNPGTDGDMRHRSGVSPVDTEIENGLDARPTGNRWVEFDKDWEEDDGTTRKTEQD